MRLHLAQEQPLIEIEQAKIESPNRHSVLLVAKLILIGVAVLAAGEASWRFTGFQPARSDLLAFDQFYRAARDSSSAVVLIGSSHVLCDLDPRILKRELPMWDFYQLAIDGSSALPMLENLAQNPTFHGHVLCEFSIPHFMAEYPFRENAYHQLHYVQFTQRRPYLDFLNSWFFETLTEHSALVAGNNSDFIGAFRERLAVIVRNRARSSYPADHGVVLPEAARREDRFLGLHRRGKDNSRAIAGWARGWAVRQNGNSGLHVVSWVEAIRRRGGDVVFVRTPLSGSLRRIEDATYPERTRTVASLAASNITVIDFAKESTLSGFDCPDESHLDADEAERFSAALARILKDRQLLPRAASNAR